MSKIWAYTVFIRVEDDETDETREARAKALEALPNFVEYDLTGFYDE